MLGVVDFYKECTPRLIAMMITRHRCAVCGRTELDGEELEFRYCTKCEGNYEYCQDHLYTHQHVKRESQEKNPQE